MAKSPHTLTAPEGSTPAAPAGPDAVVWLRGFGGEQTWALAPLQATLTLGAATSCDVVIDSPYVSQLHATLERRGKRLLVQDAGSKNGLYFRDRREPSFEIEAADVFRVGPIPLLAMTDEMHAARPALAYLVSYGEPQRVDELLVLGAREQPVLLLGEATCGPMRIGERLHAISARHAAGFGELGDLAGAGEQNKRIKALAGGTVFVDVTLPALKRTGLSAALFSPSYGVRVIARADDAEQAARMLGAEAFARFAQVTLSPLRARRGDLARMIDHTLAAAGHPLVATDLGENNLALLAAQDWPGNLDELEETIGRLGVVMTASSDRKAAEALGLSPSTLLRWLDRRGLILPRRKR